MQNIDELKQQVAIREAEMKAINGALEEIQAAHEKVLKQYEAARDALNEARMAYVEAMQAAQ